jgi:hypothetical protein
MNSISRSLRFQIFAIALAGVSIFSFVALISPYMQTRARLKLLQPQIRTAVAAERFLRYSALEVKEAIDYGLIEEGQDRTEELQNNADDLERWHLKPPRPSRICDPRPRAHSKPAERYDFKTTCWSLDVSNKTT